MSAGFYQTVDPKFKHIVNICVSVYIGKKIGNEGRNGLVNKKKHKKKSMKKVQNIKTTKKQNCVQVGKN